MIKILLAPFRTLRKLCFSFNLFYFLRIGAEDSHRYSSFEFEFFKIVFSFGSPNRRDFCIFGLHFTRTWIGMTIFGLGVRRMTQYHCDYGSFYGCFLAGTLRRLPKHKHVDILDHVLSREEKDVDLFLDRLRKKTFPLSGFNVTQAQDLYNRANEICFLSLFNMAIRRTDEKVS